MTPTIGYSGSDSSREGAEINTRVNLDDHSDADQRRQRTSMRAFVRLCAFVAAVHSIPSRVEGQETTFAEVFSRESQVSIPFVGFRSSDDHGTLFFVALQNMDRYNSYDLEGYLLTDRSLEYGPSSSDTGYFFQDRHGNWCATQLAPVQGSTGDLKQKVREGNPPDYLLVVEERRNPNGCDFSEEDILVSKFAQGGGQVFLYSPLDEGGRRDLVAAHKWTSLRLPDEDGGVTFSDSSG